MLAIGDSLSDLACSDDEDDGKDEDYQNSELNKHRKDDEQGWVMGTVAQTVQRCMEWFRQKQMTLAELTQQQWGDAFYHFHERDQLHSTTDSRFLEVVNLQMDDVAAAPAPTTVGEHMECIDIIPGILQMPQETSQPGSSCRRLGSRKPQWKHCIACLPPDMETNSSPTQNTKPVEPVSFYPWIFPAQLITIEISQLGEDMVMATASSEQ